MDAALALAIGKSARAAERWPLPLLILPLALLAAALNPLGYIGGGFDDWHYLNAAECWARHGACLPDSHWSARWTLVAPMGAVIAALGESRLTLMLFPFAVATLAVALIAHVIARNFGRAEALATAAILLLTPVFAMAMTTINIDTLEFACLAGALAAWTGAIANRSRPLAIIAGLCLALAVQTRETSLVYAGLFGLWFMMAAPDMKRILLGSLAGFAVPMTAPMLLHHWFAGDALLRYRLALGHTAIASQELRPGVDLSRSPLFNPDFIAGWVPANGIDLHWTINPIVNLLSHPQAGIAFVAMVLLAGLQVSRGLVPGGVLRPLRIALAGTAAASLLLAYGFAMDPKVRIFLPLIAAMAATAAVLAVAAWRQGHRALAAILAAMTVAQAVPVTLAATPVTGAEEAAAAWLTELPGPFATNENTRRHLALVPGVRDLRASGTPETLWLEQVQGECPRWFAASRIVRAYPLRADYPRAGAWLMPGHRRDPASYWLCLTRGAPPPPPPA